MSRKAIIFIIVLILFLCIGMWRYAVLWQSEQTTVNSISVEQTDPVEFTNDESDRIKITESFHLPLRNSAPNSPVQHTIPLEEIKRGCYEQDCIPSIDEPQFVPANELTDIIATSSLGIVLWDADRFYPFPMLETHELVNDTLPDGTPVLISYCPLCGTGIVFNRNINGQIEEFGVSGMLWQSNLLMYNRNADLGSRNLWSQILGQAVVGQRAGEELSVVPSDIITFATWLGASPTGETLVSGTPQDPYAGDYYAVASTFQPDFVAADSPIAPETYVHGIVINDQPKAYPSDRLFDGMTDIVSGERVFISVNEGKVSFFQSNAALGLPPTAVSDVEGFWFAWQAAHPSTLLYIANQYDSN